MTEVNYENLHTSMYNSCPKCGGDSLVADHMDYSYDTAWRRVECQLCGFEYQEVFDFLHNEDFDMNVLDEHGNPL